MTTEKQAAMNRLSTETGKISALAIDQRGALKKMMNALGMDATAEQISEFKTLVSSELTPFASAILLDPEYGLPAANARDEQAGLLLAYEKTGYDATKPGRLPDLLEDWSALRLKIAQADAVKFLLYYDVDEDPAINHVKHVFVERLGSECAGEDRPFYLELVSYDATITDSNSIEYAKIKPHKVIEMMKEFSRPNYKVDVLKVEVPVNMNYVEGFATSETCYTQVEAQEFFKEQSEATNLPFIFLSAGVSTKLFQETLVFAHKSGSDFNGVLCGRATWKDGVKAYVESGRAGAIDWLQTTGRANIEELNEVVEQTATPWYEKA
ncbi:MULTISPECIES: tagatose-bisphosphate aldolase [Enterococcus]|uniref:Tagatose 1,6-diphosphate aldolase n=1 Tax=Enterococcus thailandicus TaxID=417368 RepID=A0A179ERR2_ENTTH|nr:tagatose-bisphosphate aldolase [Enterococcus thailandicus]MDK4352505.1 tagatose-bisphosphate aldolase [Enterococcus thailandicus]MDT2734671.1 tagatose-bisphosphate aldolase [Enterococcus thailandicus]MDT2751130.1 tagatose-bisphosphate aldolase [Enterococcus thailandicus]MDT2775543.1 tagatose-bisphosphate aldolase [Enterococcus thailandicus]MDT2794407.1 tagatose-bisphosphate aldolase [Enterococcus thailandicus]